MPSTTSCHALSTQRQVRLRHLRLAKTTFESGAALVEAAIVLPAVALLLFGMLEYGLLFSDSMRLASGMRSGARTGAAVDVTTTTTDYSILQAVRAASGQVSSSLDLVVVYRSTSSSGQPSDVCKSGIAVAGECNVYSASDLTLTQTALAATGHSNTWPLSSRIPGSDYVGVWGHANHRWLTGLFGQSSRAIADHTVMRLQPRAQATDSDDSAYWPSPIVTAPPPTIPPSDPGDGGSDPGGDSGPPNTGPPDPPPPS